MTSLPSSGNIREVPLPVILQDLQTGKATGALIVRRSGVEKCIYVKNGQIVFATSSDSHDRLGEMLVKAGLLSREHLDAALKLYQKNAGFKKIGAILVENGFVSPQDLFTGLKSQVKEILFSLFLWDDAEYSFGERLPPDVIQLQFNLPELIREIIARIKRET
ncbi:MAG TPA: DUF4388 domain-containing protein [Nitrospirota bacterium]|nr:DUF4388 domain-containing protein [Nitrospirota bacterium]